MLRRTPTSARRSDCGEACCGGTCRLELSATEEHLPLCLASSHLQSGKESDAVLIHHRPFPCTAKGAPTALVTAKVPVKRSLRKVRTTSTN